MSQSSAEMSPSTRLPEAGFRLSPQQQRLWKLCQSSSAYRICCVVEIEGDLDRTRLEQAVQQVTEAHGILRARFVRMPGSRMPVQVLTGEVAWKEERDLASLPPSEQETAFDQLWTACAEYRGDEEEGGGLELQLVRLAATKYRLLVNLSPLRGDGATLEILVQAMAAAYAALPAAERLPYEGLSYVQFAAWQNELIETPDPLLEEAQLFWAACPSLAVGAGLPVRSELARLPGFAPERVTASVEAELRAALATAATSAEMPEAEFLFACWCAYLWRWTKSDESSIGYVSDGRPFEELREVMGPAAKPLPIRQEIRGEMSFRTLAAGIRARLEAAQEWQDYFLFAPASTGEDDGPATQGLAFEYEERMPPRSAAGLTWTLSRRDVVLEPFQLKLGCIGAANALTLELVYDSCLYDRADAERLLQGLLALVRDAARHPDERIDRLQILGDDERIDLHVHFNDTAQPYPQNRCFHELFEAQAQRTPEAVAVRFGSAAMTYRELDAQSGKLAAHLKAWGVGPEIRAGLCLTRSPEMVVALLAILRAGGAYVPLDASYPLERLAQILEDSTPAVVLTQTDLRERLPQSGAPLFCLDSDVWPPEQGERADTLHVGPDNLAYVLFTSGSTGRPKGVMVPHRGLSNYLHWCTQEYQAAEGRGTLVDTPIGFDLTITSLLSPLMAGQTAILVPEENGIEGLAEMLGCETDITLVKTTPSHLEVLSDLLSLDALEAARLFVIGGDALRWDTLSFLKFGAPDTRLVNEYGPTETVVGCCTYEVPERLGSGSSVPIGRPIANTRLYLLDASLQAVPTGMPGELYIGGAGVARGYLDRPDLTAERFIPDPNGQDPGARLYKTGDLCRHLSDGNLEYLGRTDHQVKIRGYRIELGEIESVLLTHPNVDEVLVLAREDTPGEKRLVAYIVGEAAITPGMLREYLQDRLPDYMTPAAFVLLKAMPLTSNGKVDRQALPLPEAGGEARQEYVAPRIPIEEGIAEIWSEVLGQERVSIHDSFFEVGGHSLLATQVLSRIRSTFQVELPLRALFEAPTVAGLAEQVSRTRGDESALAPPLVPVSREQALPLSFAQQRLWFLDQLDPGSSVYTIPLAIRLTGALDVPALERTLQEIVRRHEALRTTFVMAEGVPGQVIGTDSLTLDILDLSGLLPDERAAETRQWITQEQRRPFDLAEGPLFRANLLRLGEEEHLLLLSLHHIVADGWSVGILRRELAALYNAFVAGQASPLPELPLQYADYAAWQRDWLQGEVLARQIAYWKEHLEGAPALLALPTDRPRPAMQTFAGATRRVEFPEELRAGLKRLGQQEGATLFMTVLAAFQVLLARYSGQDQIVVGTPIANRTQSETEGLIGFFVNTLALRGDLSGDPSFVELLGRAREVCLGAYAHQDLPFEKLVEELQPERNLSHAPIFQVAFGLQNAPGRGVELEGLQIEGVGSETVTAKYDLLLNVSESHQGLRMGLEYNTDLFDAATIARMLGHFQTLLEGIVADPSQRISRLPILSLPERQQLVEWNATAAPSPQARCLHQLFEEQVARTPEAVAVEFEGQTLTYAQLNARANQLAHLLMKLGVGPDVLVGLCVERSAEMIVGLLAILKAGGAYVPLDPAYPTERLAFMLADSRVGVLVTQQTCLPTLPDHAARVVCLETDSQRIAAESEQNPPCRTSAENLAYVIYTSGSTGTPKGVLVPHGGLCNITVAQRTALGIVPGDRILQFASLSFDASIFEIVMALGSGATLCVGSREALLPGPDLARFLRENAITAVTMPPSALSALPLETFPALRTITVAGEECPADLVARWAPVRRFFNLYGPTETTIWATCAACAGGGQRPTIGVPIPNVAVYVLDAHGEPVPVGVAGELYIGGMGVARGYLNRADLTAEKFVPDPFRSEPGARMYRSGDRVRYLPDGNLEFLGRMDHQVKIRGFRVEPGEIENALLQHPLVKETIVVAREDEPGDRRLVAYVAGQNVTVGALREALAESLPAYLIPSAFVFLEALPLSANGKVDRKNLPAPEGARPDVGSVYQPPQTPVEEILGRIWSEVLRLEQVGVHDNFFELGGDSILSIHIIARANRAGVHLTPRQVFQHQTIAGLAAVAGMGPALVSEQGVIAGPVPLTPIQRWFLEGEGSEFDHFNQARLLQLHPSVHPRQVAQAIEALTAHHDALRLRFIRSEAGWEQTNAAGETGDVFSLVDLSHLPEAERSGAITAACAGLQASLNLETGPLLRVAYFDLGPTEPARLLLTIHHLAMDGVSWRIVLEDLQLGLEQLGREESVTLPAKTTSFQHWAKRLAEHAQSDAVRAELDYWATVTSGQTDALPRDFAGGCNLVSTQQAVRISLGVEETRALLQEVPAVYQTQINDVLLTALAQAFRSWTGKSSLLIDLEGHGREALFEEVDLSRTVGWFTSLYPALLALPGAPGPGEALKGIKETLRQIPNGGIGYGLLRYLASEEEVRLRLAGRPKAEVSFNYHGRFDQAVQDSGLFAAAQESTGPSTSLCAVRSHLLEVIGQVTQDQLQMVWLYSGQIHDRVTIERLAASYVEALRALIAHCQSSEAGGYTPSDFPKAKVSQQALDRLLTGFHNE